MGFINKWLLCLSVCAMINEWRHFNRTKCLVETLGGAKCFQVLILIEIVSFMFLPRRRDTKAMFYLFYEITSLLGGVYMEQASPGTWASPPSRADFHTVLTWEFFGPGRRASSDYAASFKMALNNNYRYDHNSSWIVCGTDLVVTWLILLWKFTTSEE